LASLIGSFPTIFGATASIEDLRAHEPHLRELGNWYRRRAPELDIATVTYFETRDVRGLALIVDPTSTHPGVGEDPVGVDEDHLSIAKPREPEAQVCLKALEILSQVVLASRPAAPAPFPHLVSAPAAASPEIVVRVDSRSEAAPRLPRELPAPAERFFGRPAELERLTERLRQGKDTAVSGPAGMGKTALAAQALRAVVGETAERLAASPFRTASFSSISTCCAARRSKLSPASPTPWPGRNSSSGRPPASAPRKPAAAGAFCWWSKAEKRPTARTAGQASPSFSRCCRRRTAGSS
jgi:hypothetical protein